MAQPVVFVLNGPHRSGKDTAAEAMVRKRRGWVVDRIGPSTVEVAAFFGIEPAMAEFYETVKDEPIEELAGSRWRDFQIEYGNEMRAKHGELVFAEQWVARNKPLFELGVAEALIMPNCRFEHELRAALAIGGKSTLLYRVYRTHGAHHDPLAWVGDIGSWLFPEVADVPQISLFNDGHIDDCRYFAFVTSYQFFKKVSGAPPSV